MNYKKIMGFIACAALFTIISQFSFYTVPEAKAADDVFDVMTLTSTNISIGTNTATTYLAADSSRKFIRFVNTGTNAVWLSFGTETPAVNKGLYLAPNGTAGASWESRRPFLVRQAVKGINGLSDTTTNNVAVIIGN